MKKYIIIAGVNGAGKSTLYQTNESLRAMPRVAFYDNTENFRRFAICKNGVLVRVSRNVPYWFTRVIFK